MRPDLSGVIISEKETSGSNIPYIEVIESGGKIRSEILSFIFLAYVNGHFSNFTYQVDGGTNKVGSQQFLQE